MSSKSSGANEKLTPIDGRWKFHFRFGVQPFVHSFHRPKNKKQKKSWPQRALRKGLFCFYFWSATPSSCCCVFVFFLWRRIEGFSLNGLQIYAVSTEKCFQFRVFFDDERFPGGEGVGKRHRLLIYIIRISSKHLLAF